jgi:hypothetical protein
MITAPFYHQTPESFDFEHSLDAPTPLVDTVYVDEILVGITDFFITPKPDANRLPRGLPDYQGTTHNHKHPMHHISLWEAAAILQELLLL